LVVLMTVFLLVGALLGQAQIRIEPEPASPQYIVLDGVRHQNLTVFPVRLVGEPPTTEYLTLKEALDEDLIKITETPGGDVNTVLITNYSTRPIYIMAGEVIIGGKQDRTLGEDLIVPPKVKNMRVKVFCVEHGRWRGTAAHFGKAVGLANIQVRAAAQVSGDQAKVWSRVASANKALRTENETGTYRATFERPEARGLVEPFVRALRREVVRDPRTVGVVVAVGEDILCADLYGTPGLFRKFWPGLLQSYATEAAAQLATLPDWALRKMQPPTKRQAAEFLHRARTGRQQIVRDGVNDRTLRYDNEGVVGFELKAGVRGRGPSVHQGYYAH